MSTIKNTSYKVHVNHTNQSEVDAVNIEDGAMLHTTDALYMGHNNNNVVVYPQNVITVNGWARYDDTVYTSANKLSLTDQVEITLPNNAGDIIKSHPSINFYDTSTNKFIGSNVNDVYQATIVFKKSAANANQTHLDFHLNGTNTIIPVNMSLNFYKANDQEQDQHILFQYYIDSTALANGLTPKIQSHGGTAKIWDIKFFIQRTQNSDFS